MVQATRTFVVNSQAHSLYPFHEVSAIGSGTVPASGVSFTSILLNTIETVGHANRTFVVARNDCCSMCDRRPEAGCYPLTPYLPLCISIHNLKRPVTLLNMIFPAAHTTNTLLQCEQSCRVVMYHNECYCFG